MSADNPRVAKIRERLEASFNPSQLEITDDSHQHAGHTGARGGGHFTVHIVAGQFAGKTQLQRHRMVYDAMADLMQSEVHALSIRAEAPNEAN